MFTRFQLPLALFAFLLLLPALGAAQSLGDILSGNEEEEEAELVISSEALILVNGDTFSLSEEEELVVARNTTYDVAISQLKPNSRVFITFYKAGVKAGRQILTSNQRGEYLFEYTTPTNKAQGSAVIEYTASDGTEVQLHVKVKLR